MVNIIEETKRLIGALWSSKNELAPPLLSHSPDISDPDIEALISKRMLNDLLKQNLPFQQTIPVGSNKEVVFSIAHAFIEMSADNQISLRIQGAAFRYGQRMFHLGLHSNSIELTSAFSIAQKNDQIYLSFTVDLSELDIRYIPNRLAGVIFRYLKNRWLKPLVEVEITKYLNLDYHFDTGFGEVGFKQKLKSIAVQTSLDHIRLKLKYCD